MAKAKDQAHQAHQAHINFAYAEAMSKKAGISWKEASRKLGYSSTYISYHKTKGMMFYCEDIIRLAKILSCDPKLLAPGADFKNVNPAAKKAAQSHSRKNTVRINYEYLDRKLAEEGASRAEVSEVLGFSKNYLQNLRWSTDGKACPKIILEIAEVLGADLKQLTPDYEEVIAYVASLKKESPAPQQQEFILVEDESPVKEPEEADIVAPVKPKAKEPAPVKAEAKPTAPVKTEAEPAPKPAAKAADKEEKRKEADKMYLSDILSAVYSLQQEQCRQHKMLTELKTELKAVREELAECKQKLTEGASAEPVPMSEKELSVHIAQECLDKGYASWGEVAKAFRERGIPHQLVGEAMKAIGAKVGHVGHGASAETVYFKEGSLAG